MRIVRSRRKMCGLIIGVTLLLATVGCSGSNDNGSATGSPTGSAPQSQSVSPSTPASVSPTVPPAATPDPVSSKPDHSSPAPMIPADQSTGQVTAVRLADPMTGWTGGDGWFAHTKDGGKSWQVQARGKGQVRQIFALNASEVWATWGTDDDKSAIRLTHSTDGGQHWEDAGSIPNGAFFHFTSSTTAFSGNARTADGGKTWKQVNVPAAAVGDVYFHDANNGWAVTKDEGEFAIRRTTDGGKKWTAVMTKKSDGLPTDAIIRSTGKADAWVELVGDSGMTQTSYSLFHTVDGGKNWRAVLANSGAGSGPAPGFKMDEDKVPHNGGNSPGMLYAVNPDIAFMGGQCQACDKPNSMGMTTDGGKSWVNLPGQYPGYGPQQIAAADAAHVWWINTDHAEPSKMYVTSDGGKSWKLVFSFDKPAAAD